MVPPKKITGHEEKNKKRKHVMLLLVVKQFPNSMSLGSYFSREANKLSKIILEMTMCVHIYGDLRFLLLVQKIAADMKVSLKAYTKLGMTSILISIVFGS